MHFSVYLLEPNMLVLAGLCLLLCIGNILHFPRRASLATSLSLTPTHARWGVLGLLCSVACSISSAMTLQETDSCSWAIYVIVFLWVVVCLLRALYLAAFPYRLIFLRNATLLSLAIFLTTNVPRQLYPMIWLETPSSPRLSLLDVLQFMTGFASSIVLPIISPNSYTPNKGVLHPSKACSVLSRWWLYNWISPLVTIGYQSNGSIHKENLFSLPEQSSVEYWQQEYDSRWHELFSFRAILWKLFRSRLASMALFAGLCGFFELLGTVGLYQLLLFLQFPSKVNLQPWFSIALFGFSPMIRGICMQTFEYYATHTIGDWKALIVTAIYRKLTRLEANEKIDIGHLQSILSVDIDRLGTLRYTAMTVFMVPIEFITASVLLYKVMGWYYIPSLLFLLLTRYPLSRFIISEQTRVQSTIVQATDKRVTRTSEFIRALMLIKILGNAQVFIRIIIKERTRELNAIWLKMRVIILSESLSSSCSFMAFTLCLCLLTLVGGRPLKPDIVFTLVAVFNVIKSMLMLSVLGAGQYAQAMVSLQRLSDFLDREEFEQVTSPKEFTPPNQSTHTGITPLTTQTAGISDDRHEDIRIHLINGGINMITGKTGSGKTLLLHSLLLDQSDVQDNKGLNKAQFEPIAYASQEPWLLRGSIRDNILFGTHFNSKRYERVIHDCALEKDLAMFKDGDLKEVGECGRSLSGGQRQRVALARAMYMKTKIVILDDILSGLDPDTFEWIVTKCVMALKQQDRTLIMVTNNPRLLQVADMILHLENGRIARFERNSSKQNMSHMPVVDTPDSLSGKHQHALESISHSEIVENSNSTSPMPPSGLRESPCASINHQYVSNLRYSLRYLRSFGNRSFIALALISTVGAQAMEIALPAWLSIWSAKSLKSVDGSGSLYLGVYAGLGSVQILTLAVSLSLLYSGAWKASRKKHSEMITAIFGATYSWIWNTPVGQVINRCSSDTASLDDTLFKSFRPVLETYLSIVLRILTVSSLIPLFLLPSVLLTVAALYVGYRYRFAATSVKHIYAASLTPLHHSIAEVASGLMTIHAFRAQKILQTRFNAAVTHHVQAWNAVSDLQRWLAVRMDIFVALISVSAATLAVTQPHPSAPTVGLSLTLTTGLCTALLYLVYLSSLLEVEMASYSRIEDYIQELPQEAFPIDDEPIIEEWPVRGLIRIEGLGASYALDQDEILKGIDLEIKPAQRVSIVGRTGCGKTSLALSLLRFTTRTRGTISIDGADIESLGVDTLRQSINFIPQDPTLLDGTIRFNLDFNGDYDDAYLQSLLDDVAGIRRWKLDDIVELNGRNLSQGERQLFTLARAMVSKQKIIILDEGTASLDKEGEDRIMAVLQTRFKDCTVIAITHRLHSILDFDHVLVMDDGRIIEEGNPRQLLNESEGRFKTLYMQQCRTDTTVSGSNVIVSNYDQ